MLWFKSSQYVWNNREVFRVGEVWCTRIPVRADGIIRIDVRRSVIVSVVSRVEGG